MPRFRPAQTRPVVHVPALLIPQHGWPAPPQVPHWFPAVANTQPSGIAQAMTPASTAWVQQA